MNKPKNIPKQDSILTEIVRRISGEQSDDGLVVVTLDQTADAIPDEIFETFRTQQEIDNIFSDDGGVMRASIYMIVGEAGVGKTSVLNDILSRVQRLHKDVDILFISSEESLIDRAYNHRKAPGTGDIPTLFLADYPNTKIKSKQQAIEVALGRGYDIIMIDSFKDCQDKIKIDPDNTFRTDAEAEAWLINLMVDTACGANNKEKFTSFLCIQQIGKGGNFVGSNSLKHNTTAMGEMRFDDQNKRYFSFSKNRRCGAKTNHRVYYTFNEKKQCIEYTAPIKPKKKQVQSKKKVDSQRIRQKVYRGNGSMKEFFKRTSGKS